MSCIGVDLGTSRTVVAVARNRGVDTICNEVSNRATPSTVTFGPKCRYLGEAAKTQELGNFRSSVCNLRRLIGLAASASEDVELLRHEQAFVNCPLTLEDDLGVKCNVSYLGEQRSFSSVEVLGMFIGRIQDTVHAEVKVAVSDLVVAVPAYFNERQRRALQDAAAIAGVNFTRMISEPAAIALSYGMPRSDLVTEETGERLVCFVDCGYAATTVSVVAFSKGKAEIKAVVYDAFLGGRDFDALLASHFEAELRSKGTFLENNPKARFRLRLACERAKRILSANQTAVLNVENLANDRDFSSSIPRADFEQLSTPLLSRLQQVILKAFQSIDISVLHSVEVVGGSTRIPAIRELIKNIFGREPCTTLNQDEAVARGCALQSALLSPSFKAKEYAVSDFNLLERIFTWQPVDSEDDGQALAFPVGNLIPSTKLLTFSPRVFPFDVSALFVKNGQQVLIGTARIDSDGISSEVQPVKLKVRLTPSHLSSFEGIAWADGSSAGLKLVTCYDSLNLPKHKLNQLREQEVSMASHDKLVADTADSRNSLEEYIYEMRNKLDPDNGSMVKFASSEAGESLLNLCSAVEDWLYTEEGEEATKSVYLEKLAALKKLGEPIVNRAREFEARPDAESMLRACIQDYIEKAASPAYEYLGSEDLVRITSACQQSQQWIDRQLSAQSKNELFQEPLLTAQGIRNERDRLLSIVIPILSKPRPKLAATPSSSSSSTANTNQSSTPTASEEPKEQAHMDVDESEHPKDECCNMDCSEFEHCGQDQKVECCCPHDHSQ
jgi:heat shock protein 4